MQRAEFCNCLPDCHGSSFRLRISKVPFRLKFKSWSNSSTRHFPPNLEPTTCDANTNSIKVHAWIAQNCSFWVRDFIVLSPTGAAGIAGYFSTKKFQRDCNGTVFNNPICQEAGEERPHYNSDQKIQEEILYSLVKARFIYKHCLKYELSKNYQIYIPCYSQRFLKEASSFPPSLPHIHNTRLFWSKTLSLHT